MSINELNKIIEDNFTNPVYVSEMCYPEVEEMYLLSPAKIDKYAVAKFYQKYDYQGVRNVLDLIEDMDNFKNKLFYSEDKKIYVTPSQYEYLKLLGWNVSRLGISVNK